MVSIRRISGRRVPPLADPARVRVVVMGEAPGPLGADVTLYPFWGDRAGRLVYRALASCECASWPGDAGVLMLPGHALVTAGVYPVVRDVWLTNAWDRCPTDDRVRFRAPRLAELRSTAKAGRAPSHRPGAGGCVGGSGGPSDLDGAPATPPLRPRPLAVCRESRAWMPTGRARDGVGRAVRHPRATHPAHGVLKVRGACRGRRCAPNGP